MTDSVYDKLANVLRDVHDRFPDDGFSNHQRLRGLLSDHLPDAEREIRIALDVIDEGVVDIVENAPEAERGMQIDRLVARLDTSRGIREDIARQIVQAFVYALGHGDLPNSVGPVLPGTLPLTKGDDWVGVSEAVGATEPAAEPSASSEEPAWKQALNQGGSRNFVIAAAVAVAVFVFWPSNEPSQPQGGQPQPTPQQPQPNGQPQPTGPQVGDTKDLPRVGPGAQPPAQNPNDGATGTATWYDDYGIVWSIQYNATQFQGTASTNQGPMGIAGGNNPQTGMIEFQLFDASGNVIGIGQAQFTDQTHIAFTTYDLNGNVIGQGQFHINHAP